MASELEYLEAIANSVADSHSDMSTLNGYVSATNQKLDALTDKVNSILAAMPDAGSGNGTIDYTGGIQSLCKLLSYTDLLLMVLLTFVVLLSGMVLGLAVTRWLKARRE